MNNEINVGDHVTIHAASIIDYRGLPRAEADVIPIKVNGSYIMSTGNEIKSTEITDMDAFLSSVHTGNSNVLGVYTCTATVAHANYFHRISIENEKSLSIQLYQSAVTPTMEVGKTYTMKFVLTGYNDSMSVTTKNLYIRVTVMDVNDVQEVTIS